METSALLNIVDIELTSSSQRFSAIQGAPRAFLRWCYRWGQWSCNCLGPYKLFRTILYHANYYRLSRKHFPGIHLGSGGLRIQGFLNLDADMGIPGDLTGSVQKLHFANESIGTIYASHLLEHVERKKIDSALAEWARVLEPGGRLYLCVPDLERLAEIYLNSLDRFDSQAGKDCADLTMRVIYGGQSDRFDFHFFGYSFVTLRERLIKAGFSSVERFERSTLSFAPFKDGGYANIGGSLVSLNVVATKP